ncbi:unnamed protein product [Vitrella brassicaformis CCMP3155]|uniref:Uncharacterized protein n=1 Tax=Vitrella brassicaformis (strain CCMP3155) TaxID=1169540 RepID=A0A0G4FNY6_VITBC|nr:unnamed protein product [Vitrella brassicaformis CCMP3155]|eukprot:CEM15526.1 unnamed protein product [Vitrella brassicaformis CCMP3155]
MSDCELYRQTSGGRWRKKNQEEREMAAADATAVAYKAEYEGKKAFKAAMHRRAALKSGLLIIEANEGDATTFYWVRLCERGSGGCRGRLIEERLLQVDPCPPAPTAARLADINKSLKVREVQSTVAALCRKSPAPPN